MAVKLKLTRLGSKKPVVMAVRWNSWVTTTP